MFYAFYLQECQDKVRILQDHHSQVLNLTTNSSRGDCRVVVSENGSNILCQGNVGLQFYFLQDGWIVEKSFKKKRQPKGKENQTKQKIVKCNWDALEILPLVFHNSVQNKYYYYSTVSTISDWAFVEDNPIYSRIVKFLMFFFVLLNTTPQMPSDVRWKSDRSDKQIRNLFQVSQKQA